MSPEIKGEGSFLLTECYHGGLIQRRVSPDLNESYYTSNPVISDKLSWEEEVGYDAEGFRLGKPLILFHTLIVTRKLAIVVDGKQPYVHEHPRDAQPAAARTTEHCA
jgi:hypothetical protein